MDPLGLLDKLKQMTQPQQSQQSGESGQSGKQPDPMADLFKAALTAAA
jgi:hypothetical protein